MAMWTAIHRDDEARVCLCTSTTPSKTEHFNHWFYGGDAEFYYLAETERQCREALIARLDDRIRSFQSVIAEEKSRLV